MAEGDDLIEYQIGSFRILLPKDHALPTYQFYGKRYDKALGEIAQSVQRKYPDLTAIDIGANIGDSLALLRTYVELPVLCVEGSGAFLDLLRRNADIVGGTVDIFPGFVGGESHRASIELTSQSGTARIRNENGAQAQTIEMLTLQDLFARFPRYRRTKLIKIDTDGYDFRIIASSETLLAELKPVLFFECDPFSHDNQYGEAIEAYRALLRAGYTQFIVFDNFGHPMRTLSAPDLEGFDDLMDYLLSNQLFGEAVSYLDICAFAAEDADLFARVRSDWRSALRQAAASAPTSG